MRDSRPLPTISPWNAPFFESAARGKLLVQRIDGRLTYYPRIANRAEVEWVELTGLGSVYSYAVVWRPKHPAFEDKVPIILATIQLDEGLQIVSTIVQAAPDEVEIGSRVRVIFERVGPRIALPNFELVKP